MAKTKTLFDMYKALLRKNSKHPSLYEGDRVRLNVKGIKSHPDYDKLNPRYKEFVESNQDTIFIVGCNSNTNRIKDTVNLVGDTDNWLFWIGDLIKVE